MSETTIGIDDVVTRITEHLAETDDKYRAFVASRLGIDGNAGEVLAEIGRVLSDPQTPGESVTDLASELLTEAYTYDGDSVVTVRQPDENASFKI